MQYRNKNTVVLSHYIGESHGNYVISLDIDTTMLY